MSTGIIMILLFIAVLFFVIFFAMVQDHASIKKYEKLVGEINEAFRPGNTFKWYDTKHMIDNKPDPFKNNVYYARIIEVRDGWVMYELSNHPQNEIGMQLPPTKTIETAICEDFYSKLKYTYKAQLCKKYT